LGHHNLGKRGRAVFGFGWFADQLKSYHSAVDESKKIKGGIFQIKK